MFGIFSRKCFHVYDIVPIILLLVNVYKRAMNKSRDNTQMNPRNTEAKSGKYRSVPNKELRGTQTNKYTLNV